MTNDENTESGSDQSEFPFGRRGLLTGAAAAGAVGLAGCLGLGDSGGSGDGGSAALEHDHSGEDGEASRLGVDEPVESITVADLRTKEAPVIDVRAFGAQGDGETDDHEAIQQAAAEAPARGVLYFPPGEYMVGGAIRIEDKSIAVAGDGTGVTWVQFTNDSDGFVFSQPSSDSAPIDEERYVTVTNLTIVAGASGSGSAISAAWETPPSGGHPHLMVSNVNVRNTEDAYFTRGIFANNAWRARVLDFHYVGNFASMTSGDVEFFDPATIGIEFIGRTVDSSITRSHLSRCDVGIWIGREQHSNTEGVRIHEATLVDTYKGIVAESGPWLTVTSSHFNGRRTAVELANRWEAMVSNCLFYRVGWSRTSQWTGVHLNSTKNVTVSNIAIGDLGEDPTEGSAVHAEATTDCVISGNVMNGLDYEGSATVHIDSGCQRIVASENIARDATNSVRLSPFASECLAHGNIGAVESGSSDSLVANNLELSED